MNTQKGCEGSEDEVSQRGEKGGRCTDLSANTKREMGARCSVPGVGETLMGGIMIAGGTIPSADSTMYLKKISM